MLAVLVSLLPLGSSGLSLDVGSIVNTNTLVDAGAAVALAAGPLLIPSIAKGYENMESKYEGVPETEWFQIDNWRGKFPEYDIVNSPLSQTHTRATISSAFFLFFASLELARTITDGNYNDVYAMVLYAFAFQGDSLTHAVLASDSADGNIMQRGHAWDTVPMIAFFLYANYLDGGSWYALTDLPSDFWFMYPARLFTSPLFLLATFYAWQPLHGAGLWLEKNSPTTSFKF